MPAGALWTHSFFRGLSDADRVLVLYMLHGPQTNRIGLFKFDMLKMATDLQREPAVVAKQCLLIWKAANWIYAGPAPFALFIPTWWRLFPPENVKAFKAALRDLADVPKNSGLLARFLAYREWIKDPECVEVLEQVSRGIPLQRVRRVGHAPLTGTPESTAPLWVGDAPGISGGTILEVSILDDQIIRLWNEIVTSPIPRVNKMKGAYSTALRQSIRARWKHYDKLEYYRIAFTTLNQDPFYRGQSERNAGWTATLAWVLKKDEHIQRFLDMAKVHASVAKAAVSGCRHTPMCTSASDCTILKLKEMR